MKLIDADVLLKDLDIDECKTCTLGGDYCVDCKDIDVHKILNAVENALIINHEDVIEVNLSSKIEK